ncbi:MAG: virginiamycin B lyase family protein, partial [Nitrososphaerales archaeon]
MINSQPQISKYIREYPVGNGTLPNAITTDSKGNVWFVLGATSTLSELIPEDHIVYKYRLPLPQNATVLSWGIVVDSVKGSIWFTDQASNAVWTFDTSTHTFAKFPLAHQGSLPYQIAQDASGNIWFTETGGNRIGEINAQRSLKEYQITIGTSAQSAGFTGLAIGKDGTIWVAETYDDAVGSFLKGVFHQYALNGAQSPTGIALDSNGNIWITQHGGSYVSEFNPVTNRIIT